MDAARKLLALADLYDQACCTPAVGRLSSEDKWQDAVVRQCAPIDAELLAVNNRLAFEGHVGFRPFNSSWDLMHRLAAEHPEEFNVPDRLIGGDLSMVISLKGLGQMCRLLSKMAAGSSAPSNGHASIPDTIPEVPPPLTRNAKLLLLALRHSYLTEPVPVDELHGLVENFLRQCPSLNWKTVCNKDDLRKEHLRKELLARGFVCYPNGRSGGVMLTLSGKTEADALALGHEQKPRNPPLAP